MTENSKNEIENDSNLQIRENLVETAVNFLLNPSVKTKPDYTKHAFLKNKGLTDEEISAAFHRVQSNPELSQSKQVIGTNSNLPPPSQPYYPKASFWARLSSVSSSLIVIAVALYGLHRFYKLYIEPWLFGTKTRQDEMRELVIELSSNVAQLKNSVSTLESTIISQKEQIDRIFLAEGTPYMPVPMAVADLKTEIGNLKSLLINRHQFPAVPKVVSTPSIPVWQLSGDIPVVKECDDEIMIRSLPPVEKTPTIVFPNSPNAEGASISMESLESSASDCDSKVLENGVVSDNHDSDSSLQNGSVVEEEDKYVSLEVPNEN